MEAISVSAPGKVLLSGGYLVLERPNIGAVIASSARISVVLSELEDKSQTRKFIVISNDFKKRWEYSTENMKSRLDDNRFISNALHYTLLFCQGMIPQEDYEKRLLSGLRITISADPEFYTQDGKTGLGSSAALVTCLVASLLIRAGICQNLMDSGSDSAERELIFRLSQLSHSVAQGKIGSGFDVSAAVYGSQQYIRHDVEALNRVLHKKNPTSYDIVHCIQPEAIQNHVRRTRFSAILRSAMLCAMVSWLYHTSELILHLPLSVFIFTVCIIILISLVASGVHWISLSRNMSDIHSLMIFELLWKQLPVLWAFTSLFGPTILVTLSTGFFVGARFHLFFACAGGWFLVEAIGRSLGDWAAGGDSKVWTHYCMPWKLPKGMGLVLLPLPKSSGSETAVLAKNVLKWRESDRISSSPPWNRLVQSNENFLASLESLIEKQYSLDQFKGSPLSEIVNTECGADLMAIRQSLAEYTRDLHLVGKAANTEIVSDVVRAMIQKAESESGVIAAGVPGAGGGDAIYALIVEGAEVVGSLNVYSSGSENGIIQL